MGIVLVETDSKPALFEVINSWPEKTSLSEITGFRIEGEYISKNQSESYAVLDCSINSALYFGDWFLRQEANVLSISFRGDLGDSAYVVFMKNQKLIAMMIDKIALGEKIHKELLDENSDLLDENSDLDEESSDYLNTRVDEELVDIRDNLQKQFINHWSTAESEKLLGAFWPSISFSNTRGSQYFEEVLSQTVKAILLPPNNKHASVCELWPLDYPE